MVKVNENFIKLPQSYLFSTIGKKVAEYKKNNPEKPVISLGIGDVTRPLCPAVIDAMNKAVAEMAIDSSFRGYPPEQGYAFLRETILENDYLARGINLAADEIFVSDGAKSDTANIGDIFDSDNIVAVCDPVYPVYVDTNVMYGRAGELGDNGKWDKLYYMECNEANNFLPELPTSHVDLIYLCFPNNPTGGSISREALQKWVDYALLNDSIILYDSAYEAFITDDSPHSIFEIEGATKCAIEFRSFSKTAGFTGVRCAFTVVPKELMVGGVSLNALWNRRQCTKFNGVSYITQCAAAAIYSVEGKRQIRENIDFYMGNAKIIREALEKAGLRVFGGLNAPYIWVKTPDGVSSWAFFDMLLENVQVVGTPGSGFGPAGEGYFRLTAFGSRENTLTAVERISKFLLK